MHLPSKGGKVDALHPDISYHSGLYPDFHSLGKLCIFTSQQYCPSGTFLAESVAKAYPEIQDVPKENFHNSVYVVLQENLIPLLGCFENKQWLFLQITL